jgi:hypothetical protein
MPLVQEKKLLGFTGSSVFSRVEINDHSDGFRRKPEIRETRLDGGGSRSLTIILFAKSGLSNVQPELVE